jgi:hypothetical protein
MPETTNSQVNEKAKVWLQPEQVEELRNAVGTEYLKYHNREVAE